MPWVWLLPFLGVGLVQWVDEFLITESLLLAAEIGSEPWLAEQQKAML